MPQSLSPMDAGVKKRLETGDYDLAIIVLAKANEISDTEVSFPCVSMFSVNENSPTSYHLSSFDHDQLCCDLLEEVQRELQSNGSQ